MLTWDPVTFCFGGSNQFDRQQSAFVAASFYLVRPRVADKYLEPDTILLSENHTHGINAHKIPIKQSKLINRLIMPLISKISSFSTSLVVLTSDYDFFMIIAGTFTCHRLLRSISSDQPFLLRDIYQFYD